MKIFKVRSTSNGSNIKYKAEGYDWTHSEIEEVEEEIGFIFGPSMTPESIDKVKTKWSHKQPRYNDES